jgi:microcystin-dependent protein
MATRRPLIVNSAANQIQELTDSDGLVGNGTIPIGGIIMWSGSIASIPTGWALCNGSSGTPDLRSRFIVGATSDASTGVTFNADTGAVSGAYAPGNTGGETAHQLTTAEMPSHSHQLSRYSGNNNVNSQSGRYALATTNDIGPDSTNSTGADDYHENRPPYYALAFIMRTI